MMILASEMQCFWPERCVVKSDDWCDSESPELLKMDELSDTSSQHILLETVIQSRGIPKRDCRRQRVDKLFARETTGQLKHLKSQQDERKDSLQSTMSSAKSCKCIYSEMQKGGGTKSPRGGQWSGDSFSQC